MGQDYTQVALLCLELPIPHVSANSSDEEVRRGLDAGHSCSTDSKKMNKLLLAGCDQSGTSTLFKQVKEKFVEILAFRQSHRSFFDKSDLFFVCMLQPLSFDIQMQVAEIEAAQWMPFEQYAAQPFVQEHDLLRFGGDVMENVLSWTKGLCMDIRKGHLPNHVADADAESVVQREKDMSGWSVLDIGTGNGLLLQELAKQGFSDLTGTDYSEGAVDLARSLADRDGFTNVKFLVDDILETKLDKRFLLVMDKGTLDAIGLHPDGPIKRIMYWDSVSRLVAPGGLLVITSCNSTKDELVEEVDTLNQRRQAACQEPGAAGCQEASIDPSPFRYLDHVRTYPTFTFGVQ